ncbi:Cytochrome P450 [Phytophthora megakarya]|uniref:Cytochrome P450 n=1 Tax=Phytophthora megakarya TaxID=4795 RepID=A0A225VB23_9STRA|nr:Cytochrome P450 [Phytophthora megakarya]
MVGFSRKATECSSGLPYLPSCIPWVGNMLEMSGNLDRYHEWLTGHSLSRDGYPFALHLLGKNDVLYLSRPEHFEDVMKTHNANFNKSDSVRDTFDDFLGENIVLINGERWLFQRKVLVNLFSARALREYVTPITQEKTMQLQQVLKEKSDTDQIFDMQKLMNQFTLDIFAEIGFGCKLNLLTSGTEHLFEVAFDDANQISCERFSKPTWLWKFQRYFNLGSERRLREAIGEMNDFILNVIKDSMKQIESFKLADTKDRPAFKNILTILLNNKQTITPTEVRNIALTGLEAGRGTTGATLVWLFHLVSLNPRVEKKLRAEIFAKFPVFKESDSYIPSYEELNDLPYMEATIMEVLRLAPSVPTVTYHCTHDTVLRDNTFIPAGTDVFLHLYAAGRLSSVWGSDVESFTPERFLDAETGKLLKDSPAMYSFGGGPRSCIGKNMAMLEMKTTIATVISRFTLIQEPGQDVRPTLDLTLTMKNPLMMRVAKYREERRCSKAF